MGGAIKTTSVNWPTGGGRTYVFTSPDYALATPTDLTLKAGSSNWIFGANGSTTFPTHEPVSITGNLTVGNLFVNGTTTTISTASYSVEDNIIQIAANNPADTLDLGFVAHRTVGSVLQHTGLVRDTSAGNWKLFSNVTAQPGNTVDFTNAVLDNLELGTVTGTDFKFANGVSILSTVVAGTTYSNSNVASYLVANPQSGTYSNANVASYLIANPQTGTYSNVDVIANLQNLTTNVTTTANVTAGNIVTSGATSGNISGANYISANVFQVSTGIFWANGTAWSSSGSGTTYSSTGAGNVTISGSAINLTAVGPGAVATGSSTAIPVVTTDAYGRISSITTAAVVAPAGTLSGSTLNSTVTASSLTSVGTLASLSVTGNVSTGNISATQVTATTGVYSGNITAANIITTGTYGNITGANVISANTLTVTTTVRTVPVTFANLPSASSVGAGARAFITDGNTTTFASAVTGSGANSVPVYSNGTGWFVG
jgi:hypothetical protein